MRNFFYRVALALYALTDNAAAQRAIDQTETRKARAARERYVNNLQHDMMEMSVFEDTEPT